MSNANIEWWRGAVIYQVYPRSFYDSNSDGIGDLAGVTQQIKYIASLGVDAIWLSPFFTSPMKDFGYDVSDYCDVDPIFGSLTDFDALIEAAHHHGIKVIIDQVMNHTSDQHPWFKESRDSRDNDKADWYIWHDAKPDGTAPNNWLSVFGGPAWQWDSRRRQYYLHNFLDSQPDLNFHNEDVVNALLDTVKFWLDRGVDGFRLDTANYFYHDQELRDNPPKQEVVEGSIGVSLDNPYGYQLHLYDKSRPENIGFLMRLRKLLDQYPGTTTVGEVGCDFSLKTMAEYTQGNDKLHMCYSFDLLTHDNTMTHINHTMTTIEEGLGTGWPCWSMSNHDVERVASRWNHGEANSARSKVFMAMLLSLRGSVCLYQGEELGLPEAELTFEQLVDPFGINFWPEFKGRDGCRTPFPWENNATGGFSEHDEPWLPVAETHKALAVSEQEGDRHSVLHAYRDFIHLRKHHSALVNGDIEFMYSDDVVLIYRRYNEFENLLVAVNTSNQDHLSAPLPLVASDMVLPESIRSGRFESQSLILPPYSVYIGNIES
ncbi:alpha-glucosidase [Marinomonas piezotolerans]|uniref:Alpha-glucosidase n=1 Tax=Marinomonas piezotolerans TaxID=2213058 RepID=A0A370UDV4_9GAMM|nr:alpha-glucosidase [Marinomonas piezotolerans]RDL45964.1 alpha-glucosidase [Marinomonas piezotolerans]